MPENNGADNFGGKNMIFESHAHYDDDAFDQDREELLGSMQENANGLYENFFVTLGSEGYADCLGNTTLHDVAEDSDCTIEDLKKEGFSADTIEALRLLTHEKSVPYMDYIAALKGNSVARKVKLADLAHNSDIGRLAIVTDKDLKRLEKYQKARNLLLEE